MKTVQTLPLSAVPRNLRVKKLLLKSIICLTSEKIGIFAGGIGASITYYGFITDSNRHLAIGALIALIGFMPWSVRNTVRDFRHMSRDHDNGNR